MVVEKVAGGGEMDVCELSLSHSSLDPWWWKREAEPLSLDSWWWKGKLVVVEWIGELLLLSHRQAIPGPVVVVER